MGFLKGPVTDGVVQVKQKVNFTDQVQSSFFHPWSNEWYVDGTTGGGSDDYNGTGPSKAKATIQAAVTAASGGDKIYIRPKEYQWARGFRRYTEQVTVTAGGTAGSGNVPTNANLAIIGVTNRTAGCPSDFLGPRWKHPTDSTTSCLIVEAPGTHIENIGFFAESALYAIDFLGDGATWSKGGADGSSVYNCAIKGAPIANRLGGDGVQIVGCKFQMDYNGAGGPLISMIGSAGAVRRMSIRSCEFVGGNANNATLQYIEGTHPLYDLMIRDCYFSAEPDAGGYILVNGTTNTDGLIANCFFATDQVSDQLSGMVNGSSGIFASGMYDQVGVEDISS